MELSALPTTTDKKLRRLGQGHGSGRGKTGGRGTKGQKARGKVRLSFEGGALPLVKRLPFLRGRGRNQTTTVRPIAVNIEVLNKFGTHAKVDVDALIKAGYVSNDAKKLGVKIIGNGNLKVALTVALPATKGARKQIEAAGGTITSL